MARSGGRKLVPAALRIVRGTNNVNPGRENPDTPAATGELGPAPDGYHLTDGAKVVWKRDAPHWPDESDRAQFAMYCMAVDGMQTAYDECEKAGWWYTSDKGNILRHPAAGQFWECFKAANRIAAEFGMNPTARNKVHAPAKPKSSPADEFRDRGRGQK